MIDGSFKIWTAVEAAARRGLLFVLVISALVSNAAWSPARAQQTTSDIAPRESFQAVAFTLEEKPDALVVKTPRYAMTITREGFAYDVRRGDTLVLQTAQAADARQNMDFDGGDKPQRLTTLTSFAKQGDRVVLEYKTSAYLSRARVEIIPGTDTVRVRTWQLKHEGYPPTTARFRLEPSGLWYGGGFQGFREPQVFPLNRARLEKAHFLASGATQAMPVWYATSGVALWVRTPHDFAYSINKTRDGKDDGLLSVEMRNGSMLAYDIIVGDNMREMTRRILKEVGYPRTVPPADFFRLPIYTTWVEYKSGEHGTFVSQEKVLEFARLIRENNLPCGVIELDDKWEAGYGDFEFDPVKFPDPKRMVDELHRQGIRATLWVHPFVNTDTRSFRDPRIRELLVKDASGDVGMIGWWQGAGGIWDFTNPAAGAEFRRRLQDLQRRYGFDGFKFDGGDINLVPRDLRTAREITAAEYADIYNREATAHFPWNETRVGVYSQRLGIVRRLMDKNSIWGFNNGLAATIPEAVNMSMRGYPYVMPDMIGGNQYDTDVVSKELLIRWAQASALMPLMQFSRGAWNYDAETVRLAREASELHVKFAPYTYRLAQAAPQTGEPIIAPLWYHAPDDKETYTLNDQFMLGTDVVVAPVIVEGATKRDVYLPRGRWRDYKTGARVEGGRWLRAHPAPLDTLPVFIREDSDAARSLTKQT